MSILDADVTAIAFCWRLQRRDGVCLGFTTHDRDLVVDGLIYRAMPGMLPSAVALSDAFDLDTLDVAGALSSDAISEADLMAGRWDGAAVRLFMVDWQDTAGETIMLARGALGDVSFSGNGFSAELRGPTALLERPVVEQTSPECRARLGDKRCRVDLAGRVTMARVVSVVDQETLEIDAPAAGNIYGYGRLRWIGGENSGLESALLSSDGVTIVLREAPPFAPAPGDLIEISEGCDKRFETCAARFANAANFRGEPHLPGTDLLTRYPGA